jgi:hypothetical protein
MVLLYQTAAPPWETLGGKGAPMNFKQNSEQTDPYDVAVAALKQASQQIGPADKQVSRVDQQVSVSELDAARHPSVQQKRLAVPPRRSWRSLALRGLIGLLVAACIGAAAMVWRSHGDASEQLTERRAPLYLTSSPAAESPVPAQSSPSAVQASASKAASPQSALPTAQAQTALADSATTAVAPPPGQERLLQSMARGFLAAVEEEIEQLKTSIEQLKTSQEQLVRDNAGIAEQLKAAQEQMVRDTAAVVQQLKTSQEQMAHLTANASEQQLRPKTSAPPPRPIANPTGNPVPKPSPQARAQPPAPVRGRPE